MKLSIIQKIGLFFEPAYFTIRRFFRGEEKPKGLSPEVLAELAVYAEMGTFQVPNEILEEELRKRGFPSQTKKD